MRPQRLSSLGVCLAVPIVFLSAISSLRFRVTESATPAFRNRESVPVGYLPVTCHLTCPVTDHATRRSGKFRFESQRFSDFASMSEALKGGRLQATFMIAPLAMKLRDQGIPVRILYLGHRDGSTLMVRSGLAITGLAGLRGRRIAVPSRYSNQYLVLRKLMERQNVPEGELDIVEVPPPDMPAALGSHAIDAYFVGEPHAAKSELAGTGRVLHHAKDIWPGFISCVLVAHENLILTQPEAVKELVRGIASSGQWAEDHRLEAAALAAPYFRQDEQLIRFVLTSPKDRVSYRQLDPGNAELERIQEMALTAGLLNNRVRIDQLVDRSFSPR